MYIDFLIRWWWAAPAELEPLLLTLKKYGWFHAVEVVLPLFTMICFFTAKGRSLFIALFSGSLLLMAAVFVHRFLLMPGAFNIFPLSIILPGISSVAWHYPIAIGQYTETTTIFVSHWNYSPTVIEYLIGLLPFGLGLLVISVAIHTYNFLPGRAEVQNRKRTVPPHNQIARSVHALGN